MGLRGAPLAAVGVDILVVTCSHRSLAMLSVGVGARTGLVPEISEKCPCGGEITNEATCTKGASCNTSKLIAHKSMDI